MENSDRLNEILKEGFEHLGFGLPRAALFKFREAIRIDPQSAELRCYAGTVLLRLGQSDQALQEFEEASRLDPDNSEAYQGMAAALRRQNNPVAQRLVLEYASRLPDESWWHHMVLADLAEAQKDYDGALAQYRIVQGGASGMRGLPGHIGHILLQMHRDAEAHAVLLQAVREEPGEPAAFYNLGLCELRLRRHRDAYLAFSVAVSVDPRCAKAFAKLSRLDLGQGRWRSAWAHFMTVVRLNVEAQNDAEA